MMSGNPKRKPKPKMIKYKIIKHINYLHYGCLPFKYWVYIKISNNVNVSKNQCSLFIHLLCIIHVYTNTRILFYNQIWVSIFSSGFIHNGNLMEVSRTSSKVVSIPDHIAAAFLHLSRPTKIGTTKQS